MDNNRITHFEDSLIHVYPIMDFKPPLSTDETINEITNAKNRDQLIEYTQTLDRLLRAGNWMIPLFHDPLYRIAFKSNLEIPNEIPIYGFNPWNAWEK